MLYEDKVKTNREAFIAKVITISQRLSIEPEWLMQVMMNESGLNHQIVNPTGGATGLIQFMPDTAAHLGTSCVALKAMTNVQQLDYVYKYLAPFAGKITSYIDLYFTVFFPIAVGKPDDWTFQTSKLSASKIAIQNPVFDINKDGKLTVAEVREAMLKKVPTAWLTFFDKKKQSSPSAQGRCFASRQQSACGSGGKEKRDGKNDKDIRDLGDIYKNQQK
ncbi:MAG: transglycosylase SLT domain-containing protein [Cytophagaceae bacterium]|jgi:hypothetical protein|nr:transglycosylase SLT domain-containing protein [Cytophagaceae bacterium]